jgi:hypothetical protein
MEKYKVSQADIDKGKEMMTEEQQGASAKRELEKTVEEIGLQVELDKFGPGDVPKSRLKEYPDFKQEGGTTFADRSFWYMIEKVVDRARDVSVKLWRRIDEPTKEKLLKLNPDNAYLWTPGYHKE